MKQLVVDPDIAQARSLPADFYTDEDYFEASKELIFSKTWQYGGLRTLSHNIRPLDLLPGFLDEPLLVINESGARCFSNVCTHRGKTLVDEQCSLHAISCGYHGRKFDLYGKFVSMPEFEGVRDFPGPEDDLTPVMLESWSGIDFVSLNPCAPFSDFFSEIRRSFAQLRPAGDLQISESEYLVNAHWALYCENYLEGLHIPFVHKSLNREIDFETYSTETFRYSSLQRAAPPRAQDSRGKTMTGPFSNGTAAYYYFVFPNLMFNFYPWGCSVNIVEPKSTESTLVRYLTLITDHSRRGSGAGSNLETVELEDQGVVEAVQKGIRSRYYKKGRYSVKREAGTHHFHVLIADFMNHGASV